MLDPSSYFQGFREASSARSRKAQDAMHYKVLKKFFGKLLDVDINPIWKEVTCEDKMAELRSRTSCHILRKLYMHGQVYQLDKVYQHLPSTPVWREMLKLLDSSESREAILLFKITGLGYHVLHNLDNSSRVVVKEPKIIWTGLAGKCLTLEHIDVFLEEYQ